MLQLAIPVFVLMSVAALLGFMVAWTLRKLAIQTLESELVQIKNVNYQIESERQNLVQHANFLQSEKENLLRYQSELDDEKKKLMEHLDTLSAEKKSLENLLRQNKGDDSNTISQKKLVKLEKSLAIQRREIEHKEKEIQKYRDQIVHQLPPREVEELKERFKNKYNEKKEKWEEKYRSLHFKLLKVARERDELKKGILPTDTSIDFSKNKKRKEKSLDKIKRKFSEWQDRSEIKNSPKNTGFISSDYGEIETSDEMEEIIDNLQIITGISDAIEEKLNALGIYRYEQISRLEEKDILLINKILDLNSDYILKNKWVTEAKKLK